MMNALNVYGINKDYCFNILKNEKELSGKIKYCNLKFIFEKDCETEIKDDSFNLYIGYMMLSFSVTSKKAKRFSGFNSYKKWINKNLELPVSVKGELYLNDELENQSEKYIKYWSTYFDKVKNIICIGDYHQKENDVAVEFCANIIAVLEEGKYLKTIWIKNIEFEGEPMKGIFRFMETTPSDNRMCAYYNAMVKEFWEKQSISTLEIVIRLGCEVEFKYKGLLYGIYPDNQVFLVCSKIDLEMGFDTSRELIMYSMIDGKYLIDIMDELKFEHLYG